MHRDVHLSGDVNESDVEAAQPADERARSAQIDVEPAIVVKYDEVIRCRNTR